MEESNDKRKKNREILNGDLRIVTQNITNKFWYIITNDHNNPLVHCYKRFIEK